MKIFTIGFTKKTAQKFFELLKDSKIDTLIDVRLNNTSQLAGFAKMPDIEYFLKKIIGIKYIHDDTFAPTEKLLKDYKNRVISWEFYEETFNNIMKSRKIDEYILNKYSDFQDENICLLCSEDMPQKCHRGLVAHYFENLFNITVVHL